MTHDRPGAPGAQVWVPQELPASPAEPAPEPQSASGPQPPFGDPAAQAGYGTQPGPAPYTAGYGQAPYGRAPYGQAPYGRAPYGQAPYGQQPYGQPPFPQGGYRAPARAKPTPTLAIVGLVLAFFAPPFGLVVSIIALVRARAEGTGRGLAIGGLVVSILIVPIEAAVAIPVFLRQLEITEEARVEQAFDRITDALAAGDCDAYLAGSTPAFRMQINATTCEQFAVFADRAAAVGAPVGNVQVSDVHVDGDDATVTTAEQVFWDDGTSTVETFDYWMVRMDGAWLLDSVSMVG